ncbi:hypothetical protein [Nonomuraea sp. NPDC049709]|uniref:nSTAND1 domain-containing NTPase n=1 Tax=Nonomuraea sp. NPDC049709 TaxID=3154736 RepID=UPI003426F2F2
MGRPERDLNPEKDPLHRFATELRKLRIEAGKPSYRELAKRAHFSVTALAEAAGGAVLPSLAVTLAYVEACGGDRAEWEERWRALDEQLKEPVEQDGPEGAPYLGLRTYEADDAKLFVGRESTVRELCDTLRRTSFLAVFGPSGVGKSSLLRAGLLPTLRAEHGPDGRAWPVAFLTPGELPLRELAVHLANAANVAATSVYDALRADPSSVRTAIAQVLAGGGGGGRMLVVVDQFEEVFTLCEDEDERAPFVAALLAAATEPAARVVIAMRADFYGHCAAYADLVAALRDAQVLIGPMDEDGMRQVVRVPAERAGLKVERELVELVVDESRGQPGALSLISHALLETWRRRRGGTLTVAAYRATGGVHGAVAQTAERVYTSLPPGERELVRHLLSRLIVPGQGTEDTRRRAARTELAEGESTARILAELVAARLVTVDEDTVTIAHEALIRGWPRLRGWLEEDRGLLLAHRRLTEAAAEWDQHGRDDAFLYRGSRLSAWDGRSADRFNALERAFLDASHRGESAARGRRRRRARLLTSGLLVVVLVVSALAAVAMTQARQAADHRDVAVSRQLAAEAQAELALNPERGLRLARQAHSVWPTVEAETALRQALIDDRLIVTRPGFGRTLGVAFSPGGDRLAVTTADGLVRVWDWVPGGLSERPPAVLRGHEGEAWSPAFSPDGRRLATTGLDGTVRVWDLAGRAAPLVLRGHKGPVWGAAFGPDGRRLASIGDDSTLRLWDLTGRADPVVVKAHRGVAGGVAFDPDGRHVATGGADQLIRVWDLDDRAHPVVLKGHTSMIKRMAFTPDGTRLASAGIDGTARIWAMDDRDAEPVVLRGHEGSVEGVAVSRDGHRLAAAGDDGSIRVFGTAGGGDPLVLRGHDRVVWNAEFSADGRHLVSVGDDGTVRVWDAAGMGEPAILRGHRGEVWNLALSPDGTKLASGGADHAVRLWDVSGKDRPTVLRGHTGQVYGLAFGPGGRLLASGSGDTTVRIWDTTGAARPRVLRGHDQPVGAVAFAPDGRHVASISNDGTLRIWPVDGTGPPRVIKVSSEMLRYVAWSPDGRYVATSGLDGLVRLYATATYGAPAELRGHEGMVWAVAFSADSRRLASVGSDATVRVWDVAARGAPLELRGHQGAVWQAAFAPDGRWVATSGHDDTLRLWHDGRPGTPLTVTGFAATVEAVAFRPPAAHGDGAVRLATAHGDGTVRLWTCDACAPIERILTESDTRLAAPTAPAG